MAKSKFFRAFVAGNTISDGRVITPEMIDEVVATFSVENYAPRINVEHVTGYSPEPPFNGYGTVIAVKAQDDKFTIDGKEETRRALYAQVDGNDQLVALSKLDQKPFPSVELTDSYAGTGKVGLVGLAFTDRPASIGTQALKFSRSAPGTVFATGDEAPTLAFEAGPVDSKGITAAIASGFATVAALFSAQKPTTPEPVTPPAPTTPPTSAANDNFSVFATAIGEQLTTALKPMIDAQAATVTKLMRWRNSLDFWMTSSSFCSIAGATENCAFTSSAATPLRRATCPAKALNRGRVALCMVVSGKGQAGRRWIRIP
nr:GPO family capsid scaffolding protein [Sphingomonas sp. Leaf4]